MDVVHRLNRVAQRARKSSKSILRVFSRRRSEYFPSDPAYMEDLFGLPGDISPNLDLFYRTVDDAFESAGGVWSLAGDQAWEYYNVPKDQELVVPAADVDRVVEMFTSMTEFCIPFRPALSYHHRATQCYQRFKCVGMALYFLVIPDTFYSLELTHDKFVQPRPPKFPIVYLRYFIVGIVEQMKSGSMAPSTLQYLVDAIDIDEEWCLVNGLERDGPTWKAVMRLSDVRHNVGNHPKYSGYITEWIANEEERQKARSIPGRDLPHDHGRSPSSSSAEVATTSTS